MPALRLGALLLALVLPGLLAACASDYGLSSAPPEPAELPTGDLDPPDGPGTAPAPPDLPEFPDLPDLPDLPDSPWEDLNPGDLPEVYLAVAWSEFECCWYCDALDPYPMEPDILACWSRFAVVDLHGQVVAEFQLPHEVGQDWSPYSYLNMVPAGPGRFLAVVNNWDTGWDDDTDDFPSSSWWEAWLFDATQNTTTRVAHWDMEFGGVTIDGTDRLVYTGDAGSAPLLSVWPHDPDRLVLWLHDGECPQGAVGELHSIHMTDPEAPVLSWKVEDLLPEGLPEQMGGLMPWSLELGLDDDGEPVALLGAMGGWCGNGDYELRMLHTSLDTGTAWDELLWGSWSPLKPTWTGRSGGAALHVPGYTGDLLEWQLMGPDGTQTGTLPEDMPMAFAGPVIDPEGPTFAVIGGVEGGGYHHVIDVVHQGESVWRIDALRFGLQERGVFFADVDLLWPPAQE